MVDKAIKIREKAARRRLARQGYHLVKTRRRDPRALDYAKFSILPIGSRRSLVDGLTLEDVEAWINADPAKR